MQNIAFRDEETDEHVFYRKVSMDGRTEICVHAVLYGFRIRAGYVGRGYYELDYCAGDKTDAVESIYGIVLTVLSGRVSGGVRDPFNGFPCQERKPMHNDPTCLSKLLEMTVGMCIEKVELSRIREMKTKYLSMMFSDK